MAVIARSAVVGIVASRAAQISLAFGKARRHHYADTLKPDDPWIVGADRRSGDQSGNPMALAAEIDLDPRLSRRRDPSAWSSRFLPFAPHRHGRRPDHDIAHTKR